MDPITNISDGELNLEQYDEIKDPLRDTLNLDFEEGVDHWSIRSGKLYQSQPSSIELQESSDIVYSGDNSLKLRLVNTFIRLERKFNYRSGDTVSFDIQLLLDLDSNWSSSLVRPYIVRPYVNAYEQNGEQIAASQTFVNLSVNEWNNLGRSATFNSNAVDHIALGLHIMVYDSVDMFLDYANINYVEANKLDVTDFNLLDPLDSSLHSINDTLNLKWSNGITSDGGSYTVHLYAISEVEEYLMNGGFEIRQYHDCKMDYSYPSQFWCFPWCYNNPNYNNSIIVSDEYSRTGSYSLRMGGLFSDSLRNFNTTYQTISDGFVRSINPGTEITFEGYIFTPDSNSISGFNNIEIGIWSWNENENNYPYVAPNFDSSYTVNEWHKFSISGVIPEFQQTGQTRCGIYLRYNQVNNARGAVYIDDLSVKANKPSKWLWRSRTTTDTTVGWTPEVLSAWYDQLEGLFWSTGPSATGGYYPNADKTEFKFQIAVVANGQHGKIVSNNLPEFILAP